jgi:hypothetical protein
VNHRKEKSLLAVTEAQVRNEKSVERELYFQIALYSALLLAAKKTYENKPQT